MSDLTPRETEIHEMREKGMLQREIANELGLSIRTIELHCSRIAAKTGDDRRARQVPQYVYFVEAENGLIKIGVASDYTSRFKILQSGCPMKLKLLTAKRMTDPRAYEAQILDEFNSSIKIGEWIRPTKKLWARIKRDFQLFG